MDTGRGISYNRACQGVGGWGNRRGITVGGGNLGGIALGEIPNVDDRVMGAANHHHGMCIPM